MVGLNSRGHGRGMREANAAMMTRSVNSTVMQRPGRRELTVTRSHASACAV